MSLIHPTAIVGPDVKLGKNVEIGPFCMVAGDVTIGDGTRLISHVSLGDARTKTVLGKNNSLYAGAAVGGPPQDLTYKDQKTELIIGDNNIIREYVTMNCGTPKGGGVTRVGSDNMIMAYVHIAHDGQLGSHIVIANSCQLAGHVTIGDHAKISGNCLFNQFVVLGEHCYIAGDSAVNKDIMPYCIAQGKYAVVRTANEIGMERAGFSKDDVESMRRAVRILTKSKLTLEESLKRIEDECNMSLDVMKNFMGFVKSPERKRGLAL